MPRKGETKGFLGDEGAPSEMVLAVRGFLEHQKVRNYSAVGMVSTESALRAFADWSFERNLMRPSQITKPILESYQRWVFYYRKHNGKPLTFAAQRARLQKVRVFFKWLARTDAISSNPASELELPRVERRLPRAVLSEREIEKLMRLPEVDTVIGLRDRAMMEVFYSTGMRRHELAGLGIYDVDREGGTVVVRLGKGKRDRTVPIGERALSWVEKYLRDARPMLMVPPDEQVMFLSAQGGPIQMAQLTQRMRDYVIAAKVGKTGACHVFRHTMATLMLEGGADVRHIQEILGHAETSTTAIYTRVSIRHLKQVHEATHPGAKLAKTRGVSRAKADVEAEVALEKVDPASEGSGVAALYSSLAAEEEEDVEMPSTMSALPATSASKLLRLRKARTARTG
jgi:integrase/recombinase XerD